MNKKEYMIILGTAHLGSTAGKCSPDKTLKEAEYSRSVIDDIEAILLSNGYNVVVDYAPLEEDANMRAVSKTLDQQNRELIYRARYVNSVCEQVGKDKVLYVCIHVDAAGADGKWHDAGGWSAFVSLNASANSKRLANRLFDAAKKYGLKTRVPTPNQKYWEKNLYVLTQTKCPAVLTENLFQDNKQDVEYLLSDTGRHAITRLHVEGIISYLQELSKT